MLRTLKYFLSRAYTLLSIGLFIFTYTALKVGAIYYPTDNITNPTCAPGDSGCYVSLLPDQTSNSGSLLFTNGTNPSWTGSSSLSWDSMNGRLGVGTSVPTQALDVSGKISLNGSVIAYRPTTMTGTLILGDGGNNLSHTAGAEGYYNTFVGISSGLVNTTGNQNTAIGMQSLFSNTTGTYNTASGLNSLSSNTTGSRNTATGMQSLFSNTTGEYNTANGMSSLFGNTTGAYNTAYGYLSGRYIANGASNQTSNNSLYLGYDARALSDGGTNEIVIGSNAVGIGSNTVTLGNNSIITTALKGNVGIGTSTPNSILNIVSNLSNVTTNILTASESSSTYTVNGNYNTTGYSSLTYGNVNSGITNSGSIRGMYSEVLRNAFGTADNGTMTSIFGNRMLYGHFNNDVAATPITTNVYGLFLYPFAKTGTITNLYDLYIANPNSGGIVTNHWALYQNDVTAKNYFAGNLGIATTTPSYKLHVGDGTTVGIIARFQNSTGTCDINPTTTSLSCSSDRTLKTNITNLNNTILNQITTLQPVTYTWINDNTNQQQTGFIAQDVEQIFPNLVSTDPTTNLKSLNYIGLIPYTIEGIKELDIKVNQQASLFNNDQNRLDKIKVFFDNLFGQNKICVDDQTCLTKSDIIILIEMARSNQNNVIQNTPPQDITENVVEDTGVEIIIEEEVIDNLTEESS